MIEVEFDGRRLYAALNGLQQAVGNLRPVLLDIGEELLQSTKKRFRTKTGPDGVPWALNTPVTIERKGHDKVLIGGEAHDDGSFSYGGTLSEQISYHVIGDTLEVGSTMEYAATQQFGASKGEFGRNRRGGPIPWGDIPARPFLGISNEDESSILDIIREHLEDSLR